MLHIFCPHCGELRSEEEFHAGGQAHIPRPLDPNACTDEEWGEYLFFRDNPRGGELRNSRDLQDRRAPQRD